MKTVFAPDTAPAYLDAFNAWTSANPVTAYGIMCAALMVAAWYVSRYI